MVRAHRHWSKTRRQEEWSEHRMNLNPGMMPPEENQWNFVAFFKRL